MIIYYLLDYEGVYNGIGYAGIYTKYRISRDAYNNSSNNNNNITLKARETFLNVQQLSFSHNMHKSVYEGFSLHLT